MKRAHMLIPALAAAAGCAYLYYENRTFGVTRLELHSARLAPEFDGFTVALISDVHDARPGRSLAAALEALAPDMAAIAGDLLDSYRPDPEAALELVRGVLGVCPVYYVPGNHEARFRDSIYPEFAARLRAAGAAVLYDETAILRRGAGELRVVGLMDPAFTPGRRAFPASAPPHTGESEPFTLLISHRPERFGEYCAAGADLALCGHAHGGQVRVPLIGPLFAPHQGLFPRYTSGLYECGSSRMAVSRGLGNSGLRLRVNNRPELVTVKLRRTD